MLYLPGTSNSRSSQSEGEHCRTYLLFPVWYVPYVGFFFTGLAVVGLQRSYYDMFQYGHCSNLKVSSSLVYKPGLPCMGNF